MSEGTFEAPPATVNAVVGGKPAPKIAAPKPALRQLNLPASQMKSPAGIDLIQGLRYSAGAYFLVQAENTGGPLQDLYISRLSRSGATFKWEGYIRVPGASHGSSVGVRNIDADEWRIIIPHDVRGVSEVTYKIGSKETRLKPLGIGRGNPCLNQDEKVLAVISGTTCKVWSWPNLSLVREFKIKKAGDARFQGSTWYKGHLYCAFDSGSATRGYAHKYNGTTGKLVKVFKPTTVGEPQGFMIDKGLWIIERIGGLNKNRVVRATLTGE